MVQRTIDLLPEIFRTQTNKQFFAATLDQLTQESNLKKTYGFVGRRIGPGVNPADKYVTEPSQSRADYQLETGITFFKPDTNTVEDAITYPGIIDALNLAGANTTRQDRLFESQYYSWDPFCDLDKFVNYSQYYWLPQGPDPVTVQAEALPVMQDFTITRNTTNYVFSDVVGKNPVLYLSRGGNYTFTVDQPGHNFYIQAAPGVDGVMPYAHNISSRDVLGVSNNGTDQGTVTFNIPLRTAQDFYYSLADVGPVDLVTNLLFNQINNQYVDAFLTAYPNGIDGITNLNNRTIIFSTSSDDGWEINAIPVGFGDGFDSTTYITDPNVRYGVWRITYVDDGTGSYYISLTNILEVPQLRKTSILFGTQYSSTQWYRDTNSGYWTEVPLLTATADTLYYQDSSNPEIFGLIRLTEPVINIDDIIGAKTYTSPNGVTFTNGLKIQFSGTVLPSRFQNQTFYVEGVGSGPGVNSRVGFVDGEAYFGPWHTYQGQRMTGSVHDTTVFQQYIYDTVEESIINTGAGGSASAPLPTAGILGATLGNGIKLLPVSEYVTPETYTKSATQPYDITPYDSTPYDAALNAPEVPDYITINRSSADRNAWARSNRWFHIDVINASAQYNNTVPVLDNNFRGKRPIIEFRGNIRLWRFGTQSKGAINIIDFATTDALSDVNGQLGYGVDGYNFIEGSRVVFAADRDPQVRNRIYQVHFIDPNNSGTEIIDLVPIENSEALINQTVVCLSGNTLQGKSFYYDGAAWLDGQEKTSVNQAPLFDVYDLNGYSFGDRSVYPSTTFAGNKLFGYAIGSTTLTDEILGFALKFANINNVGDIVFDNYFYTDTFLYVLDNVSQTNLVSSGFVRQYTDRAQFSDLIGWQKAAAENRSRQTFRFIYDGSPLVLDVPIDQATVYPPLQVYIGSQFIEPNDYTVTVTDTQTFITINNPDDFNLTADQGTVIEVEAISNVASDVGFYQVPLNLSNNPLNENSNNFTLGTIRQHYESLGENLKDIVGPINGPNNTRDLGDIIPYGDNIVQHSSPLALSGPFLRRQQFEIVSAIEYNSREYQKYKAILMDLVSKGDYVNNTPTQILDSSMSEISLGKSDIAPFYWSDMLPNGENYTETVYTYTNISTNIFDTLQIYDYTSSNYLGMNVYLNGNILIRGYEYTVTPDAPTITILTDLVVGDKITIREFSATYGSYVPNTPTKIGLYPAYKPAIYPDYTYIGSTPENPTYVIRGHDGSITVAYGDSRDDVLLEFETRIFNNLKIVSDIPLSVDEVVPGQFRTTEYTLSEINSLLEPDFLSWVGWNKLDYTTQEYLPSDPFTFNYSQSGNKLNRQPLIGAWRGIYNYFYDTDTPNTTPWEMLGFSQMPDWWENYYGPAPYTSGNMVLWDDLSQGLVRDPAGAYIKPLYVRPDLASVIPAGPEGELLPPINSTVGNFDATGFNRPWAFGDDGPTENAWRTSSAWPFAVMRLLALTKPAKFFNLFADRDRYVYDTALDQYLWNGRYRINAKEMAPLYGDGTSRASYINWIIDYNRQLGINSTSNLESSLSNIGVRLCWRLAGFSDKKYLKIYTERSTPNSLNASLLLPDESYQLLLYKDQPSSTAEYSSVIVQLVPDGYQVFGYSTTNPYFEILASRTSGLSKILDTAGARVKLSIEHSQNVVQIPYGYVFNNRSAVCDFLYSYGLLLERKGFIFDSQENGYVMDWLQMCNEFLYWSQQGWSVGSLINLNPAATKISVVREGYVADSLNTLRPENLILNQNRLPLPAQDLVFERLDNTLTIRSLTNNAINYLNVNFVQYESLVVLDNTSIFADLIYDPVTGARQNRILVSGWISGDWNGTVNAPGFVINQDNIFEWQPNTKYTKGQIVKFKNEYWSASEIIQPSEAFDYSKWIKSDYNLIQKGLLPNASNVSDQLQSAYSIYDANLEQEVDLFSYGLIGFRPREYMQALNLDDVSQVNLYQQFLGSKGTIRAAEIFSFANLDKEIAQYNIYEYWAMLLSQYGATANRNYVEFRLNQSLLTSDPSLLQVVEPQQKSTADQTVLIKNIWKTSRPINNTEIFPTSAPPVTDTALPTAGYVNLEDVDFTVFNLEDLASTTAALDADIEKLGIGSTIWAAKSNPHDWNVYRVDSIPGKIVEITDNLDGRSLVQFNKQHNLAVGDYLIIKYLSSTVDGAYQVQAVPSINTILINLAFEGAQTTVIGNGLGFVLQSARVSQSSDIAKLPYANLISPGSRAWVDDNGQGQWTVLEKINPFTSAAQLVPETPISNSGYGTSIAQGFSNLSAMIGAPTVDNGQVYTYIKDSQNKYAQNFIMTLGTPETLGFGNDMAMGNQTWAVIGASKSMNEQGFAVVIYNPPTGNAFTQWQLLIRPSSDTDLSTGDLYGQSVSISQDERWIYVGAPGANKVYAYGRVDVADQTVKYTTDGSTFTFNYSDHLVVDDTSQIAIFLNGALQTTGFYFSNGLIVFNNPPNEGLLLVITRRLNLIFSGDGIQDTFNVSSIYGISSIDDFSVYVNDILQRPTYDYDLVGLDIVFAPSAIPGVDSSVSVRAGTRYRYVDSITVPGLAEFDYFGYSVHTSTDGRQILVGAPGASVDGKSSAGKVYVFDRSVQRFEIASTSVLNYTAQRSLSNPGGPINVSLNDVFLINDSGNIDGDYSISGNTIRLNSAGEVGDILEVETNQFTLMQTLIDTNPSEYAQFGHAVELCLFDCSLFIGVPYDSSFALSGGKVEFNINQSRVFGTITNQVANPTLTPGEFLRINDYFVEVPSLPVWNTNFTYVADSFVTDSASTIYRSLRAVPIGIDITDASYWVPTNWADRMRSAINSAALPNVIASVTNNVEHIGDAITKTFSAGTLYSSAITYTPVVYVNNVLQTYTTDYVYNNTTGDIIFSVAPAKNAVIYIVGCRITISVKNAQSAIPKNLVYVLPGTGTVFNDLGWETYVFAQTIKSPVPQQFAYFGKVLSINTTSDTLVVGAPGASAINATIFDDGKTYFDSTSTTFSDTVVQSGAVYTYDVFQSVNPSVTNPPQFAFGQQLYDPDIDSLDQFGTAINYTTGILLIGSPGEDLDGSQVNYGRVVKFNNLDYQPAWKVIRLQQPIVNVNLLNNLFLYDIYSGQPKIYLDFFNPLQGRLLGAVAQNLDYISTVDPAAYNVGSVNNYGDRWAQDRVGQIWWDVNNVRFIDPNQDDIVYASRRWGQVFPGSSIDVYQWIASSVPPAQYTGEGTVKNTTSYSVTTSINEQGIFGSTYYFWVKGIRTVARSAGKTLGIDSIAQYIESPRSSGIAYAIPINASTVAIYNSLEYISAQDTVLHIEYDQELNDAAVHVEYHLVPQDRGDGFLPDSLYKKLQDSFCGVDTVGHPVPDPFLLPSEKYGVQFRPRQSMFVNRFLALQNYLTKANLIMAQYPIVESRSLSLLLSQQPEPTFASGTWDQRLENHTELTYQDLDIVPVQVITPVYWSGTRSNTITVADPISINKITVGQRLIGTNIPVGARVGSINAIGEIGMINAQGSPVYTTGSSQQNNGVVFLGYRYLIASDSTQNGLWTIYEVRSDAITNQRYTILIRVQDYDTRQYWDYVNWYLPGYNPLSLITAEVPNYAALSTITVSDGNYVKVTANSQGKYEIYRYSSGSWTRVALQDGTIAIKPEIWDYALGRFGFDAEVFDAQYFDQEPVTETRKIIQALNEEIFIEDLLIYRNQLLILMFNYIMSEQEAPVWLTKTSLIDVDHIIRELLPYQIYRRDNQDFVLNYIQEVKPYHTQIRQFNLIYNGSDTYLGTVNDFDVPAYWNTEENMFISPVLDDTGKLSTTSSTPATAEIWQTLPWNQWYQNYALLIDSVTIANPGSGYTVAPEVVFGVEWQPVTAYTVGQQVFYKSNLYTIIESGVSGTSSPVFTSGSATNGTATLSWAGSAATGIAIVNSAGELVDIVLTNPGSGYLTTVPITLIGGNGSGAIAVANMDNTLVRNINTTIKYDRYQYESTILPWESNVYYVNGTLVRYDDRVWSANNDSGPGVQSSTFDPTQWILVAAGTLSGVDRTMGYYAPTANEPGLDLALLISGVDYPGVQVQGVNFNQNTGYDVGNFDINPYDNISYGPEGRPTYDPAILDAIYESFFGDDITGPIPTGTAYTDINVDGGEFVDTYESHAPEELVPGIIFDTLDIRIYSTPGSDWSGDGHGFPIGKTRVVYSGSVIDFSNLIRYPATISVYNVTTGILLNNGTDYSIDWVNQGVSILSNVTVDDIVEVKVYGIGGGNQLFDNSYNGANTNDGVIIPVNAKLIENVFVFVNGEVVNNYSYSPYYSTVGVVTGFNETGSSGTTLNVTSTSGIQIGSLVYSDNNPNAFTSGQIVTSIIDSNNLTISAAWDVQPIGALTFYPDTGSTKVLFSNTYQSTDYVVISVFGYDGTYSWSTPVTQYINFAGGPTFWTMTNSLAGTNPSNVIVCKNGLRATPSDGCEYVGDGSTTSFALPNRGAYSPGAISASGVSVYVNNVPLVLNIGFVVDAWDGSSARTVTLTSPPADGAQIFVTTTAISDYYFSNSSLVWNPSSSNQPAPGDIISVTSYNDTSQQDILTQVWLFSDNNRFDTGRVITDANRVVVTVNGKFAFADENYSVIDDTAVVISETLLSPGDLVVITVFTQSVVPGAIACRIFQDMRGLQLSYRITDSTTTTLIQDLSSTGDIIYVNDASKLSQPNLDAGIFGLITINGERISYRVRDTTTNTLSGLRRGTAGTGATDHSTGTRVYDIGTTNLLPIEYQDYYEISNFLADGSTTTFVATDISVVGLDSTEIAEAVLVYVGGIYQTTGYQISGSSPVTVEFDSPPSTGYQVSIRVRRGKWWYNVDTVEESYQSLQETNSTAGRFIRGE